MDDYVGVIDQDVDQACVPDIAFNKVGFRRVWIRKRRKIIEDSNDMATTDKFLTKIRAHLAQAAREKDMRGMHNNRRLVAYNIL